MKFVNNGKSQNRTHFPTSKFFQKDNNWLFIIVDVFGYEKRDMFLSFIAVYKKKNIHQNIVDHVVEPFTNFAEIKQISVFI